MSALVQTEYFFEQLADAGSLDDIYTAIDSHIRGHGFERFAYHVVRPPEGPRTPFYIASYPIDWSKHYIDSNYVNVDPIGPAASATVLPFEWARLRNDRRGARQRRVFFGEAGEFGLTDGVTIPLHGPGNCLATFNLAGCGDAQNFESLWKSARHSLHITALYSHEAIVGHVLASQNFSGFHLSPRERECLAWTSRGKTAWEVSEILSLSEDTVTTYIKSAARKLGVYSKTHAVVKAIILGLIVP